MVSLSNHSDVAISISAGISLTAFIAIIHA